MKTPLVLAGLFAVTAGFTTPARAAGEDAAAKRPRLSETKKAALAAVESHQKALVALSEEIWRHAETALLETKSAESMAKAAEAAGFRVTRGVAGLPTALVAEFGEGKPVIGVLGEYDALPGLSQKTVASPDALEAGAAGHGCGHNLLGAGAFGAATAIRDLIAAGKLKGTIRFFGAPAEESVGGKLYMIRAGLFKDVDIVLTWHPGDRTRIDTSSSQAIVDMRIEFAGRAAHAAFDPWNGRSAVDGMELFNHGVDLMREHVRPTVRLHYVILDGGRVPNVVPDHAAVWLWARDSTRAGVEPLLERLRAISEGAALAAGVTSSFTVQGGSWEILVNMPGARVMYGNLEALAPIEYTAEEQEFARAIQRSAGVETKGLRTVVDPLPLRPGEPEGGSTDVGDVSWVAPVLHATIATAPEGAPWHAWPVVACAGMTIGEKGMLQAARLLAITMVDLYESPGLRRAIRSEFENQTRDVTYRGYIPAEGPPPLPHAPRP
ncbi:MAG TPA: amidohydrolase [Candidatus Polarisedimenticolia bacterium]|nr:amidohydrolase [Candidatus Polarisedimenticolia bacterium]